MRSNSYDHLLSYYIMNINILKQKLKEEQKQSKQRVIKKDDDMMFNG